jgi:O-antigen/teichoic acid export membrane protein
MDRLSVGGLAWRVAFALGLVLATFNPAGFSYFHWLRDEQPGITPAQAVVGIALLVLWIFLWRSMLQAVGALGLLLMAAFTGALVWLCASWGWLDVKNATTMAWVVLVALGLILGVGMSFAIVRRNLTGQATVDEIDDNP